MNTIEFSKIRGETLDVSALLSWVERHINWLRNGRYELQIKRSVKKRSLAQNKLFWLWMACMEQETGQLAQDIHDYYCYKFLPRDIADLKTGEVVRVGGHTSTLTSEAFTEFLDKIQADAATELGITLPTPEDEYWEEFEDEYKRFVE